MAEMYTYGDISDDEVSTCKERHSRLGEDNLNDTLEYDFGGQPYTEEMLEELKVKDSGLIAKQDTSHVKETDFQDLMLLNWSVPQAPIPEIQSHDSVDNSHHSSPSCDLNKDAANLSEANDSIAESKDSV